MTNQQLKLLAALLTFLKDTFRGATFGDLKMDDMTAALDAAIKELKERHEK